MAHLNRFLTADKDPGGTSPRTRKRRKAKFAPDIRVSRNRKVWYEDGLVSFASSSNLPTTTATGSAGTRYQRGVICFFLFLYCQLMIDSCLALRVAWACPLYDSDEPRLHCAALYCLDFGKRYNSISNFDN